MWRALKEGSRRMDAARRAEVEAAEAIGNGIGTGTGMEAGTETETGVEVEVGWIENAADDEMDGRDQSEEFFS
jgi:hypothetical protein